MLGVMAVDLLQFAMTGELIVSARSRPVVLVTVIPVGDVSIGACIDPCSQQPQTDRHYFTKSHATSSHADCIFSATIHCAEKSAQKRPWANTPKARPKMSRS